MIRKADSELKRSWLFRFNQLPADSKKALRDALIDLQMDARKRANHSWKKHKAPMALYWKVVSVYCGHLCRSIKVK